MPPPTTRRPTTSIAIATDPRCGTWTENSDSVCTPRLPSAFITTTLYLPSRTFQSIAALLPLDLATQNDCVAGGLGFAVPSTRVLSSDHGSISKSFTRSTCAPAR